MEAIWDTDYDFFVEEGEDGSFQRPMCPICHEPIGKIGEDGDDSYRCYNCYEVVEVNDEKMKEWFADREGIKTEIHECHKLDIGDGKTIGCGEMTMEYHYYKDSRTGDWKLGGGQCKNCGTWFIV